MFKASLLLFSLHSSALPLALYSRGRIVRFFAPLPCLLSLRTLSPAPSMQGRRRPALPNLDTSSALLSPIPLTLVQQLFFAADSPNSHSRSIGSSRCSISSSSLIRRAMESDPSTAMTRSQPKTRWGTAVTLYFSIAFSIVFSGQEYPLLTGADAQPAPSMGPLSVFGAATARTATKMYVQGGNSSGTIVSQLFSLDLAVPWSTNMPAWKQLTNTGPAQVVFPAAFSADEQTMITFHSGATFAYRYSVLLDRWSHSAITVPTPGFQGVGAVLDPDDGQVYLTGGYTSRNQISIYNVVTDTIEDAAPLPPAAVALEARAYYGSVWSKSRKSILYFGGYNATLQSAVNSNVVTEYVPSTGLWQTLVGQIMENQGNPMLEVQ